MAADALFSALYPGCELIYFDTPGKVSQKAYLARIRQAHRQLLSACCGGRGSSGGVADMGGEGSEVGGGYAGGGSSSAQGRFFSELQDSGWLTVSWTWRAG